VVAGVIVFVSEVSIVVISVTVFVVVEPTFFDKTIVVGRVC